MRRRKIMSKKQPTLIAYTVREREGQKAVWTRIGAAWPHSNGNGFSIQLEALPLNFDGRIVLAEPKADDSEPKGE
jgi:hypothetical protein